MVIGVALKVHTGFSLYIKTVDYDPPPNCPEGGSTVANKVRIANNRSSLELWKVLYVK